MNPRMNRRSFLKTSLAGAAALSLPGAFSTRALAASPLTMQAAWVNDSEFIGYFAAMDEGYFKAEGIDLTYLSGGPDVIPESSLLSGKADIAMTAIETTVPARKKGRALARYTAAKVA